MNARLDRAGQGLVEYSLIILLIAVAAFMAVAMLAPSSIRSSPA